MKTTVVLVSGYIGMGKDYFFDMVNEGRVSEVYDLWSRSNVDLSWMNCNNTYNRCKFAIPLKIESANRLGITVEQLDELKDTPLQSHHLDYQWRHLQAPAIPLYRHILIDTGNYMRSLDPDHWLKLMVRTIIPNQVNIVTDWRFPNEVNIQRYMDDVNIITVRVYRSGVDIPDISLESERLLDDYKCDIVVVGKGENVCDYDPSLADYSLIEA